MRLTQKPRRRRASPLAKKKPGPRRGRV